VPRLVRTETTGALDHIMGRGIKLVRYLET